MDAAGAKALRARLEAAGPAPLRARIAAAEAERRQHDGGAPTDNAMPLYRWLGLAPLSRSGGSDAEKAAQPRLRWWTTRESEV